jgi:hypothetical protein
MALRFPGFRVDIAFRLVPGGGSVEVSYLYQARHSYWVAGFVLDE